MVADITPFDSSAGLLVVVVLQKYREMQLSVIFLVVFDFARSVCRLGPGTRAPACCPHLFHRCPRFSSNRSMCVR